MDTLYFVIPCYNEEAALPESAKQFREKLRTLVACGKISPESRILLVNDGSIDRTWEIITELHVVGRLCRLSVHGNTFGVAGIVCHGPALYESGDLQIFIKTHN